MKTKRATKRLLALLLTFVFAMAMSVSVFAASGDAEGTGTITVTNATNDVSYAGYKIFDVTYSNDAVAYTISEDNQFYSAVRGETNLFTLSATTVSGVYNVAMVSDDVADDVITWLNDLIDSESTYSPDLEQKEPTDGQVSWNNVPYGYYLVTSSLGAVVTVDQNTPDVEIIDKNQDGGSSFTKTVGTDDEVVQIGVPFTFTLTFDATNYDGETLIDSYTVSDTFPVGMDLVGITNNVTVSIDDGSGTLITQHYTASLDSNRSFSINIPWTQNEKSLYNSPADVTVTYQAVLNGNAGIQTNIENDATLTWTGENTGKSTEETVQTYALAIMKVDNKGNALSGATFAVTAGEQNVNVSEVSGQDGVYVVDPNSKSNIVVSPSSGLIVIKGVDNIEYTLTETAAPAGYNLLGSPVNVIPVVDSTTTITIYKDANGNVAATEVEGGTTDTISSTSNIPVTYEVVINQAGTELPSTGGMGTTTIYILGAALVIGAGVVLVVRRRMSA